MKHYKDTQGNLFGLEDGDTIPEGLTEITLEEAREIAAAKNPAPPPDPKMVGIEFAGVMCSATRDDQNGLVAVLQLFQMQGAAFQPTVFYFANGSRLTLTRENIPAFTAVWTPFRQSFFQPETV